MSRDVFLQDFARLLNGYFYASHQMNQKKGTSLYSIMSTFRTHSIEIQNLRTFHFKWDFHPPPKKNKTNTANTHWTHPKPACFLHFAIESSSSASRLFEGSTLVMKAINANVRSVFCSRDLWFFWLASASGVRSALKNRRTHFCSKCFVGFFWVKRPGDFVGGTQKIRFFFGQVVIGELGAYGCIWISQETTGRLVTEKPSK